MSDYYTCKYRYTQDLHLCSCSAMCKDLQVAELVNIKKDCKKCKYYKNREDDKNDKHGTNRGNGWETI